MHCEASTTHKMKTRKHFRELTQKTTFFPRVGIRISWISLCPQVDGDVNQQLAFDLGQAMQWKITTAEKHNVGRDGRIRDVGSD